MSAMPAWAMISRTPAFRATSRASSVGDRRQAAAAVDEDRDAALDGEREDRLEPGVSDRELLRARVQLDPAGAAVEAADSLVERLGFEIEPHERDKQALRPLGRRERPVVRRAERGLAVGLVEAEHERAGEGVRASARSAARSRRPCRRCRRPRWVCASKRTRVAGSSARTRRCKSAISLWHGERVHVRV